MPVMTVLPVPSAEDSHRVLWEIDPIGIITGSQAFDEIASSLSAQ